DAGTPSDYAAGTVREPVQESDGEAWISRLLGVQRGFNGETRELWDVMSAHRRRVTREILRSGRGGRLTVFGAGNCNALDVTRLAGVFAEVHLLDLDEDAMDGGVRRQGLRSNGKIHLHGGLDFSGLAYALDRPLANADSFARSLREGVGKNLAGGPPPAD